MTYHTNRLAPAKGSRLATKGNGPASSRIVVTLPDDDMSCLCWWAAKKGVPVATVLRNAVWSYLQCVRADFERAKAPDERAEVAAQ